MNSLKVKEYDVLIVGGGHAGCEASLACARLGFNTLLVTGSIDRIGVMSCNPAIGGVGKGHLVKEIDALGGEMGKLADKTGIHFRTLNSSRGPAVRATRCQSDMDKYRQEVALVIFNTANLSVRQDDCIGILVDDRHQIKGIKTRNSDNLYAKKVILTTGTFLGGALHLGNNISPGGRATEAPQAGLSDSLRYHGLKLARLKTGTCPRLDARTINFDILTEQTPESPAPQFHFRNKIPPLPQVSCYITYTNKDTHNAIGNAIDSGLAPIYNGQIDGKGPRYCPSIEDKVVRFSQKESHMIFLEPHGLDTFEVYPNGISTSLPPKVQLEFLRTIEGLSDVEVTRWGYAVEYDFVEPTQLKPTLETKNIAGLYCAGQINGTTGYEEAAIQGLLAGMNAAAALKNMDPLILGRHEAYAGVLVDDLITLGTDEPYRMFTSRAEHRLILREDNVYARLFDKAQKYGLLEKSLQEEIKNFEREVQNEIARLKVAKVYPSEEVQDKLLKLNSAPIRTPVTLETLLKRPEIGAEVIGLFDENSSVDFRVRFRSAVELKYEGYIERLNREIEKESAMESLALPEHIFTRQIPGISNEAFEKLKRIKPQTLGQASRISGITPATLSILAIEIKKSTGLHMNNY